MSRHLNNSDQPDLASMCSKTKDIFEIIDNSKVIIFDFDGVIKDSLDAKADAFCSLFGNTSSDVRERIRKHHLEHGGVPREQKIPIYMNFAGIKPDKDSTSAALNKLRQSMAENVINSQWVPGIFEFIRHNSKEKRLYIASASPHGELRYICRELGIERYFTKIYGSETDKTTACQSIIQKEGCSARQCVYIGDALTDIKAAESTNIPFIMRVHRNNLKISCFARYALIDFSSIIKYQIIHHDPSNPSRP